MKKLFPGMLALVCLAALIFSAFAAGQSQSSAYTVTVNDRVLDLSVLPRGPYVEDGVVMVPLLEIGEALGYQVKWDADTRTAVIEDSIQRAILQEGTSSVLFEGKLKIIDLSRTVENAAETAVFDDSVFVPLTFFEEFFNSVSFEGTEITVAPQMCYLDG